MAEKSNLFILTSFIPFNLADMEKVKLLPSAFRQTPPSSVVVIGVWQTGHSTVI